MTDKINQSSKITIIIGAGASSDFFPEEFSFPVGEALIKNICNQKEIANFSRLEQTSMTNQLSSKPPQPHS
jgi:hypothetical protein